MAKGIVSKKEMSDREAYHRYLSGVKNKKNALTYYQWKRRNPSTRYGSISAEAQAATGTAGRRLREALD
jgi:hypothetical protein